LSRAGELVERDELRDALWSSDTFVDFDLGLNYCVNRLRAVLGDDARAAQYIETVPKRGYRFIAPVEPLRHPREPAVAVLPFRNLNRDEPEDYLADGMTDTLIDALASSADLRVISRHSIQQLKTGSQALTDMARALQFDAIVEGSTLRVGSRARIAARLVQVDPERSLWADCHEDEVGDVLSLLSGVARRFADAIRRSLVCRVTSYPLAEPLNRS
jgi:TolB-like protein